MEGSLLQAVDSVRHSVGKSESQGLDQPKEALHNSSRNRVVRIGMGCKAVFAANIENI